ncbi:MAG: hypothetical protein Q7R33_08655, partial [Nitrosarchaeum sp.]|nr:hypothetical protein [Nitrosarchaeum sp.]
NVWRNERKLYKRDCDLCKKSFIFMYPKDTIFPVYCRDCWLSDKWNPKDYGQEYDFNKPFFEQWYGLFNKVPRVGVIKQGESVNSLYTNRVTDMRNCYLVFATTIAENSRYSAFINSSKECLDCYSAFNSEQCSECIDCVGCYNVHYSQESQECRDSMFLFNCRNVSNCIGCVNIRNGKYMIFNEQFSKEDYELKRVELLKGSHNSYKSIKNKLRELKKINIVPNIIALRIDRSTGNWIADAKMATKSFNVKNVENIRYAQNVFNAKDCMDYSQWGAGSEMIYEAVNCGIQCGRVKFANECWSQLMDSEYCTNCHQSSYLFGCNGVRNGQYCILNKQYSRESFDSLKLKIKNQMLKIPYIDAKGIEYRYGEFFPEEFSPFGYNETTAQELFPLTKAQAIQDGHKWHDEEDRDYNITMEVENMPDSIVDVQEDLTKQIIECEHKGACSDLCTVAFRILQEDLQFYKNHNLPIPKLCPNCRHFERLSQRNPLKLWSRKCQCAGAKSDNGLYVNNATIHKSHEQNTHCSNEFQTSYSPDKDEIVYCLECYQSEVV